MRTASEFLGMPEKGAYDVEAGGTEFNAEHAIHGYSSGVLNRGRKPGNRASDRSHRPGHGRHLHLRLKRWLTCPFVAVLVGVTLAFLVLFFQVFRSTKPAISSDDMIYSDEDYAMRKLTEALDEEGDGAVDPEVPFTNRTRNGRRGIMMVLDTLQGMLWARHVPKHARGKSEEESVYHNLTHFTETYAEMKKNFKIYVYRDGYKPLVHGAKTAGIYATEGLFLKRMEDPTNRFTVSDPRKAHMFLLPYSVRQMVDFVQDPHSRSMRPMKTFIANYVETIASKYPYWNRSHGADHFFVSCHDWAPLSTMLHGELHQNAMKVVCNADLTANFDLKKDVSLPQAMKGGNQSDVDAGNLPPEKRDFLAFYAGQMHGLLRPVLIHYWKGKDPAMKIYEVLPPEVTQNISYAEHMKRSRYCLCPKGFEVNSPRIVESILSGCVPVIIADNFVLPYNDVLDWTKFSITVAEKDIPNLKKILTSISDETYRTMQSRLKHIRKHFVWLDDPEDAEYDSFHMALHSIWRQRQNLIRNLRIVDADTVLTSAGSRTILSHSLTYDTSAPTFPRAAVTALPQESEGAPPCPPCQVSHSEQMRPMFLGIFTGTMTGQLMYATTKAFCWFMYKKVKKRHLARSAKTYLTST